MADAPVWAAVGPLRGETRETRDLFGRRESFAGWAAYAAGLRVNRLMHRSLDYLRDVACEVCVLAE